ncbi:hypothetical protein OAB63_02050 [Alphaproteobacteria bacterium]|nr:hypothetical protein [Alphaproteobacteria bacterium]
MIKNNAFKKIKKHKSVIIINLSFGMPNEYKVLVTLLKKLFSVNSKSKNIANAG